MTALESFNALDNREVSRKEVEQVLAQAKAENNTAIIYRLSRVLNDSPEATHFEITITHYDSSVGLSGVQHTGDYREALDDCGRLRKGWKFVKGNVIKVEKKEKPKKGKTPKNILKLRTALSAPHQEDEIAFLAGAGIDYFEEAPDDQPRGLGKPIPAADIYKMITDKIIKMLKSTKASDYKKTWKDDAFFIPLNYDSKKPYRGVNRLLLQERIGFAGAFRNPYFLTFKQIKKHKGTLKKGAKGYEVIYYSIRYVVPADKNSGRKAYSSTNAQKVLDFLHKYNLPESEVTRIPMIRYYNVYNGADIENMDFKLDELQIGRAVPDSATENRAAQLIVENYPNPPAIKNEGNQAYYNPASDYIKLPKQEQFDTVNDYYRTLFHELTHSTGHNKRLNRGIHLMLEKDDYAKEELVAEFGAVFLSAWAGIMWYNNKNHAAYLKGWNSAIKEAQNDNKFLMRAASLAQQATDYILNLNAKGEPAFLAELAKINPEKEEKKTKKATKKPQKNTENPEHHKYFQEKKKEAEIQLKEAIERVKKSNYRNTAVEYAQVVALKCEMIKHIEENAKLYNATPAELEYIRLYLSYLTIDQVKYHFIKNDHYMSTDMVGLKPHFSRLFSKTRPKAFAKVKDRKYSYKLNENGKKFINDYVELYENFYKNPPTFEDNKIAEAEGVSTENVEDSSKKKVEKAPAKATKSLKSRGGNVQKEANFTLLQEPTKVFLEFEDEKNEIYYKKSADKQGAVGSDFLKKVLKDLKKQNLKEEPRGFINTEDFPVKPTISKITGIDSLKTIVVKDNIRPVLECVLIEADRYVATDLYNIILLNRPKNDGLKTGALYDPNYKCIKIGGCSKQEYYRDIEGGYLNYKAVLTENPVYTSDWVAIEPIVQHLKSGLEVIRKIYDRKRVYMVKITSNVGEGHYNLKYLLNDLQILQSNGAKKIRLYTNKLDNRALNIETDNGNMALTMPVYMGDRSNYDVLSPLRIAPIQLHFTQNRKEEKGLSGVDYSQGLFGDIGLNAPRHEGILKEALNDCGRLKKGWKFEKGKAVKIDTKTNKEKGTKESRKKIKIIPPYIGDIEYNEEGDNYIALEKELGDIMGAKFDQWQKEIIAHNREKKLEMYSKEIWKKIDAEKDTKEDVYVGDYEPDEKGFYYEIRQIGKKKYRLELSVHRYGRFSVYPTAIEDFKSLKECGDFLIKTLDKSNGFYYTNMLGLSQLQNKINELKGYQYSKQIHFEDEDEGLTGAVPEVSTERFKKMSVPELREYTLEYYLENYGGKSISKNFFKEDNIQIEFFNTAGKKLQKPIYKEKVAVLEHLESLIKNSTYNNWGNRKESSPPNIIGYLNFKAKVTIDGEKRHVRISIAVDEKRKFRFKTLEVGANPKKEKQATSIPAPSVTERLRDSSLSEDKGTKKSLSRKKKDENFGLNASEAPVTSLPAPRQTLAQQLATRPEVRESFLVADEQMSLFLGALEKKTKDSLVITLTGKQGSGKTRFAFQFMNALAQRYRVGHASIEEHPESVLYEEKAYQYLNDTALEHITAQDVRSLAELDTMIRTNEVIVIDSFQKMRELAPKFEVDKDLRKKYDGKLFLVIFQQTADGKMRGGSKSQFDGDIILFTETFPDYRENYVYPDKNRYNKRPATELQYSIYEQCMLATASEEPALPAHYEPTESEELNFEVL